MLFLYETKLSWLPKRKKLFFSLLIIQILLQNCHSILCQLLVTSKILVLFLFQISHTYYNTSKNYPFKQCNSLCPYFVSHIQVFATSFVHSIMMSTLDTMKRTHYNFNAFKGNFDDKNVQKKQINKVYFTFSNFMKLLQNLL